jgi:hypothetical protein
MFIWVFSTFSETELLDIEEKIIKRYRTFQKLKPISIKITNSAEYEAENTGEAINISQPNFLSQNPSVKEVEDLLKHELIHSIVKGGHSIEFWRISSRLGIASNYELRQIISEPNKTALEGRIKLVPGEENEVKIRIRAKPSWKGFKELLEHHGGKPYYGKAMKRLREIYGLSVNEIARRTGIPIEDIFRFEKSIDPIYLTHEEPLLKRIFKSITQK